VTLCFLVLALILGGASREAPLPNLILQALAVIVVAGAFLKSRFDLRLSPPLFMALFGAAIAAPALGALQLIPLPPALWTPLPGRDSVASGYELLGLPLPALPLSLTPSKTLLALGGFLPPLAVLALGLTLSWSAFSRTLRWGIVLMACGTCLFGLVQAFLGNGVRLYFYEWTGPGFPNGTFANINHQGSLMLMATPFLAAAASRVRFGWGVGDRDMGLAAIVVAAGMLLTVGVIAAGSEFGYWMFGPVVAASLLVYRGQEITWRDGLVAAGCGALLIGGGIALWNSPLFSILGLERPPGLFEEDGRALIFATTWEAIKAYWPVGSGLGSFDPAYRAFEDPATVTNSYVNLAHNEYLQTLMEFGVAGVILVVASVAWWIAATIHVWTRSDLEDTRLRRAASVALGVVFVHSLLDYPGRTAAIACLAMACAVLMTAPGSAAAPARSPTRQSDAKEAAGAPLDL
jgi:O-antigen ligase